MKGNCRTETGSSGVRVGGRAGPERLMEDSAGEVPAIKRHN